jgi:hypothetical protein
LILYAALLVISLSFTYEEEVEGKKGMSKSVLLCRTTDPEAKRNIIGDTFMTVANRVIAEMNLDPGKVSPFDIFTGNIDYFSTIEQISALISK